MLINTAIRTFTSKKPIAEAMAITGNWITKVGSNESVGRLINQNTQILDLKGKTVIPGLIDTHIHITDFGRCLMWLNLGEIQSIDQLLEKIKGKAAQTPNGKWIIGQGWNEIRFKEKRMPTIADLDSVAPNNPVILYREAAMLCVANSKAIQLAGITNRTKEPSGGCIDKSSQTGELTGVFRDTATSLLWEAVPEPAIGDLVESTELAFQKILVAGITSVHWLVLSEVELEIIQKLHDQRRLPVRVNVIVPENLLEKARQLKTSDPLILRFGGVIISVDGYLDSKEAALIEPYSDDPANRGRLFYSEEALSVSIQRVLRTGVQPVIFAMGDRAIETTLNVIEKMSKDKALFRIEQAAVLNENLVERLKKVKVVISIQPKMISTEFNVWSAKERLGLERARWLHPLRTLIAAEIQVAGGSDCPMEPLNPLLGIQEVVARDIFPEQRLSVEQAIQLYTLSAAYASGEEQLKGSIKEGKLADLTILSQDPFKIESTKIADIEILMTVMNGRIVNSSL